MKLERTKNTVRNMIWGTLYQVVNIVLPFIGRTAFIYILGEKYLGLNSLFTSILSVLNMSELGVSSAIVYSMYGAIARDDHNEICALMNFYKKCYRVIGSIIFILGSALFPALPYLIQGDVPAGINIYVLYGVNLFSVGISYFLYAYKHSLFWAFQRDDLDKKLVIPFSILKYAAQIIVLLIFHSYYAYIIIVPIYNIFTNIIRGNMVNRYFPEYKANGEISKEKKKEIASNVKALFVSKVGGTLTVSFDTIVISAYLGLAVLGTYNNYYYIMSSVIGFIHILFDALSAGWGNSLKTESGERNWAIFKEISFLNNWIICWCATCFLCLYQNFITLWIGSEYLLPTVDVILICIYFWVWRYQYVVLTCKDAAGLWRADQFRPLIVGIANLLLNIILVKILGLSGVLLSSIITWILVGFPWLIANIFKFLFKRSPVKYVFDTLVQLLTASGISGLTYLICSGIAENSWGSLLVRFIVCMIIPNVLFVAVNCKRREFKACMKRIKNVVGKK